MIRNIIDCFHEFNKRNWQISSHCLLVLLHIKYFKKRNINILMIRSVDLGMEI